MQTIRTFLSAASPAAVWTDLLNDRIGEPPVLVYGAECALEVALFAHRIGGGAATIPIASLADVASWSFKAAVEGAGANLIPTTGAITASVCYDYDQPITMLTIPLSVSSDALAAEIAARERVELAGEIAGLNAADAPIFVWRLSHITIFNRL